MSTNRVPHVLASYTTAKRQQVKVRCPFCGQIHYHGPNPGMRESECYRGQYILVFFDLDEDCP